MISIEDKKAFHEFFKESLDELDMQLVQWLPVPEIDDYYGWMLREKITFFEPLIVHARFPDGSGGVKISHIKPTTEDTAIFHMTEYADMNNMKITHYMKLPLPPVEFQKRSKSDE